MREEIRQATEEWNELDNLYKSEARKKKSKFTREELEIQQTLVQRLRAEIDKLSSALRQQQQQYHKWGSSRGEQDDVLVSSSNVHALTSSSVGHFSKSNHNHFGMSGDADASENGIEVTHDQRHQILQIYDRDREFDTQLDEIAEGLKDLSEVAMMQNEEVMLEQVEQKLHDVHEHMNNVNARMKETLNQIRGADKICIDILCICMMAGLAAVLYQRVKRQLK